MHRFFSWLPNTRTAVWALLKSKYMESKRRTERNRDFVVYIEKRAPKIFHNTRQFKADNRDFKVSVSNRNRSLMLWTVQNGTPAKITYIRVQRLPSTQQHFYRRIPNLRNVFIFISAFRSFNGNIYISVSLFIHILVLLLL